MENEASPFITLGSYGETTIRAVAPDRLTAIRGLLDRGRGIDSFGIALVAGMLGLLTASAIGNVAPVVAFASLFAIVFTGAALVAVWETRRYAQEAEEVESRIEDLEAKRLEVVRSALKEGLVDEESVERLLQASEAVGSALDEFNAASFRVEQLERLLDKLSRASSSTRTEV